MGSVGYDGQRTMINVFVIAPIRVHRDGLLASLSEVEGLSVVGSAATLSEALPRLRSLQAEVALVDASEPEQIGAGDTRSVEAKFIAVGIREQEAVAWVEAGVVGYILPEATIRDVEVAVRRVARGELLVSTEVAVELVNRSRRGGLREPDVIEGAGLTSRESEVLELIGEGLPNKLIALRLSIQEQTVKNHVHQILSKLGVHRRSEAAALLRAARPAQASEPTVRSRTPVLDPRWIESSIVD